MNLALLAILLGACAAETQTPPVTPPDTRALTDIYSTVQQQAEASAPFAIDLGACDTTNHTVALGDGKQFALSRVNDAGQCEIWVGYATGEGLVHADTYCLLEPYGTTQVVLGSASSSSSGGCGGPPGTQPLTIQSTRCVSLY